MKIELSPLLDHLSEEDLRRATIVENGDYILMPKNAVKVALRKDTVIHLVIIETILFAESFGSDIRVHTLNEVYASDLNLYEIQKL